MTISHTKAWTARIGAVAALAVLGGVGAYAADELSWYTGGDASVPDPDNVATLTFYNASGSAITTGSTSAPFAAFVASSAELRNGDSYASVFAYTPAAGAAEGAWTGSQLSGTTKFAGSGAESPTGSVPSDKPFAKGAAAHESLAEFIGANPNTSASSSALANLYEIRLRTSSASNGVGPAYASAFVKVSGSTWTKVAAPDLGAAAGETAVTLGDRDLVYGTATTIPITVDATGSAVPVGKVKLFNGTTLIGTATLNASGAAEIPITAKYFKPGTYSLKAKFVPTDANAFTKSTGTRSYTVAKRPVVVTQSVTREPTSLKNGKGTANLQLTSGLSVPTGTVTVEYRPVGSDTVSTKGPYTVDTTGKAAIVFPKKPVGEEWEYRTKYSGNGKYAVSHSDWHAVQIAS